MLFAACLEEERLKLENWPGEVRSWLWGNFMDRVGEKLDQHKQALKALSNLFYGSVWLYWR